MIFGRHKSGSREKILSALRRSGRASAELPDLPQEVHAPGNGAARFCAALEAAAGNWIELSSDEALERGLERLEVYRSAKRVCGLVPGVARHNLDSSTLDFADWKTSGALDKLDVTVAQAELGVVENGAVWVTAAYRRQQAVLFLPAHLVLLLAREHLVNDMHAAYRRIRPEDEKYGCFVSGPSKTADIEQSLVIGAHGPRTLTIVLTPSCVLR